MFKVSSVDPSSRAEAKRLLQEIYDEAPSHWPNGLSLEHFDGGCYLIREKQSNTPVGFCGWQVRNECKALTKSTLKQAGSTEPGWDNLMRSLGVNHIKVGYYSIGIKKAFRRNGFAKEALEKLIQMKSATCDVVRAMIAATNLPSQALADALGVEKLVKGANVLESLVSKATPFLRRVGLKGGAPLLGEEMGQAARQNGLSLLYPQTWFEPGKAKNFFSIRGMTGGRSATEMLSDTLGGTRFFPRIQEAGVGKVTGPAYSLGSTDTPRGIPKARAPFFGEDKLREYQAFSEFMPRTVGLDSVTAKAPSSMQELNSLKAKLKSKLRDQWVVKDRAGYGSAPGSILTEQSPLSAYRKYKPSQSIVQTREDLKQNPSWLQAVDNFINRGSRNRYNNINRGHHELRVHAINGKGVPYGTVDRGSILRSALSPFMPWRSQEIRKAEGLVSDALRRNPGTHRGTVYGFDVGIRPNGTPFIIESNPSYENGMSGFLSNPFVADSVNSGIQGRLPAHVKARRLIYGTGLVGGAAAMQDQSPPPSPLDRWQLAQSYLDRR